MNPEPAVLAASGDLSFALVLPGSWARIPLDDEQTSNREISRILRSRMPRRDELATMRREAREMMRALAAEARSIDAALLTMSLEILPGLPFASAIVAAYLPAPPDDGSDLPDRLAQALPGAELLEFDHGPGVRDLERTETEREDGSTRVTIDLSYIVPTPTPERWLQLDVDVPTELDPALVVELYDTIVNSLRWFEETESPT